MTKLVQTGGKGSMFDAQRSSAGPASDPIVWRPGDPSITGEIEVGGVPIPTITKAAREEAGKQGRPSAEYKAFLDRTAKWADDVVSRLGASTKVWEDMAAALELGGHPVKATALIQRWRVWKIARGEYKPTRKHQKRAAAPIADPAALLNHMRTPLAIPDAARRNYNFGEVPGPVHVWSINVRGPWINKAMDLGATPEQVAEALNKFGHPIKLETVRVVRRRVLKDRRADEEEQQREQATAMRETEPVPTPVAASPLVQTEPKRLVSPTDVMIQLGALIEQEVQRRLGDTNIEELRKKAKKWDNYQEIKRLRATLQDDD